MKTILHSLVRIITIFFLLICASYGQSVDGFFAQAHSFDKDFLKMADIRLTALINDPTLFKKIDQKSRFADKPKLNEVIEISYERARTIFPILFSRKQVGKILDSAFCVTDGRIFL